MTQDVRGQLIDIICKVKPKGLTPTEIESLSDAVLDGLRKRGIAVVDEGDVIGQADEHLQMLKTIRRRVTEAIDNPDCQTRDLASLTRRLQDVSREVTTIEERHRNERAQSGKNNGSKSSSTTTSAGTGPLDL